MSEWQPIETAPKDGTQVILGGSGHVDIGRWQEDKGRTLIAAEVPYWQPYDNSYWSLYSIQDDWFEPTHWQPLPEPPPPT